MILWSTVESAADQAARRAPGPRQLPLAARPGRGRVSRRSRRVGLLRCVGHFRLRQIGRDGAQLVRGERHHRHVVAGLDRLRIGDPGGELAARGRQHAGRDGTAGSPTWVRSGPSCPAAEVPRIVWQAAHALLANTALPRALLGVGGLRRPVDLRRRAMRSNASAARRSRAAPYARAAGRRTRRIGRDRCRAVGGEGQIVVAAGDEVLLAREVRHPERVDDVGRRQLDRTGRPTGMWISLAVVSVRSGARPG